MDCIRSGESYSNQTGKSSQIHCQCYTSISKGLHEAWRRMCQSLHHSMSLCLMLKGVKATRKAQKFVGTIIQKEKNLARNCTKLTGDEEEMMV